jgi:hypothetical protein
LNKFSLIQDLRDEVFQLIILKQCNFLFRVELFEKLDNILVRARGIVDNHVSQPHKLSLHRFISFLKTFMARALQRRQPLILPSARHRLAKRSLQCPVAHPRFQCVGGKREAIVNLVVRRSAGELLILGPLHACGLRPRLLTPGTSLSLEHFLTLA